MKKDSLFRFVSERAFQSWQIPVAQARQVTISEYKISGSIGFRDGTLIQSIADGKMYLVSDSKKRWITDPDSLEYIGVKGSQALIVSDSEINSHQDGEDL